MTPIDFDSPTNEVLLNPRMPSEQADRLKSWLSVARHLTGHFFILTSGSTAESESDYKWVALSKQAVLNAARGANQHLQRSTPGCGMGEARELGVTEGPVQQRPDTGFAHATGDSRLTTHDLRLTTPESRPTTPDSRPPTHDTWLHCLPDFHVGGLGIWARAHLSEARVIQFNAERWSAKEFAASAKESAATLASLVPTQVYDLVEAGLTAPKTLRAIVVGGSSLDPNLYERARTLGWPLLPSYGMTEAASQIATAGIDSLNGKGYPHLKVLSHLEVQIENETGRIRVRGASLLTGIVSSNAAGLPEFIDPKDADGWLTTDDFGELTTEGLVVTGRMQDRVKIGGELVNLAGLRRILAEEANRAGLAWNVALIAAPDARLESIVALVGEAKIQQEALDQLSAAFNARVMPFERIREIRRVVGIPRTDLGKVKWLELSARAQAQ